MGIYIKGMDMPKKGCIKMLLLLGDDDYKVIETTPGCQPQPEQQNYKAVPVPPHGRLIDADAMCDGLVLNNPVVIYAECMPTVIPAEEGER